MVMRSTGVELRFVMKSDKVTIRMCRSDIAPHVSHSFHVYRGGIQGGWEDHEVGKYVTEDVGDFVIEKSKNLDRLQVMSEKMKSPWSPEVVRVIFDRGAYKLFEIEGDIELPAEDMYPKRTLLSYGSSITHGSNSIDTSHSWVSLLAHNLGCDARNLGTAGSCYLEKAMADYIADEGKNGKWDIATLELGINVIEWEEKKIMERATYTIGHIAAENPKKPVFVISPFYYCGEDFLNSGHGIKWRNAIETIVKDLNLPNVVYINGFEILDSMVYISADEVHPNIFGVQKIADTLTRIIQKEIN